MGPSIVDKRSPRCDTARVANTIRSVTVYCSSSRAIAPVYFDAGRELGRAIAERGWTLVYGGDVRGLMGAVADAAHAAGGRVEGVYPRIFSGSGGENRNCHDFVVTECMRTRKAEMERRGDAFVALPGGLGTLEELFEIIVGRQLGVHAKPVVLLNVNDYWRPMVEMIERGIEQHFIKPQGRDLFHVASAVAEAIEHIASYQPVPPADKWFTAGDAPAVVEPR